MTQQPKGDDLVLLVADKDMEQTMLGVLTRTESLGIQPVRHKIYVHPNKDAGCRSQGAELLRSSINKYRHAIIMFDRQGCGRDDKTREDIERETETMLASNGWEDRAAAIVIDPELEAWVWSDSPEVDRVCDWSQRIPNLRNSLVDAGYLNNPNGKPDRPKEAFRHALKEVRKPPSAALFRRLADSVSLERCTDPAFLKLKDVLRRWFRSNT